MSTTPNIALAAAPPARTGASDLNPNALALVGCVHGQSDDGLQKVRHMSPLTRLPLHTCLDPPEAARSPFSISISRALAGQMRRSIDAVLATGVLMPRPADGTPG